MSFPAIVSRVLVVSSLLLGVVANAAGTRAPLSPAEIDRLVGKTMTAFSVPGIAVGIVKDGKLVFAKGYGVRELGHPERVDADTRFAIGSNTKAFTAAALAILVDEGKLRWDDKVIDYLPDFRMADPYVTREFTVRDLLTHRSGLGLGAGDLLFVTNTDFTRKDVIRALRHLKPVSSFRSQFAYDNLLYVAAGEVVAVASGQSWEDFVSARLLAPLGMTDCAVSVDRLRDKNNQAAPHSEVDGKLTTVAPLGLALVAPAGAIQCSVNGMSKWVSAQLARGKAADGKTVFSEAQSEEMWTPQTILPVGGKEAALMRTHFMAYGLGWGLQDFNGYKRVFHNGGVPGMVTHVSLIPELNLGVLVLTNQQEDLALSAISLQILEAYAGASAHDWVALTREAKTKRREAIGKADQTIAPSPAVATIDLKSYAGKFADPWRGGADIAQDNKGLRLTFSHTKDLSGALVPLTPTVFVVHWDDRSLNADAYLRFKTELDGKVVGFTMQAVSAATDFSFDFQDLEFSRFAD